MPDGRRDDRRGDKKVEKARKDGAADLPEDLTLDAAISRHVQDVLQHTQGNKSETARLLGISRSRLQRYVEKFHLDVPE
jgi:DNA-binding NtrC family response regulator